MLSRNTNLPTGINIAVDIQAGHVIGACIYDPLDSGWTYSTVGCDWTKCWA